MSESTTKAVLYRLKPDWGLPSVSIACLQVEAYLRLAKIRFAVEDCPWGSFSPTGQAPALDTVEGALIGNDGSESVTQEQAAAKAIIEHLQKDAVSNIDTGLLPTEKAEVIAYTTLLETKLIPALLHSTWLENQAFSKLTRPTFGAGLPFPLSWYLPYRMRSHVKSQLGTATDIELYDAASKAMEALNLKITESLASGPYFLGSRASSTDALLYACLAYLQSSPAIHPALKEKFNLSGSLRRYLDGISTRISSTHLPAAAEVKLEWSAWKPGQSARRATEKRPPTELQRKGRLWLMGVAAAIISYVAFSGQYFQIQYVDEEIGEDDDGGYEDH